MKATQVGEAAKKPLTEKEKIQQAKRAAKDEAWKKNDELQKHKQKLKQEEINAEKRRKELGVIRNPLPPLVPTPDRTL